MKIFDILARLGILRFGTKAGTYKSGAERPTEFLMDDVFDAKRDLTKTGETPSEDAKKRK